MWIKPTWLIIWSDSNYRNVRLHLQKVEKLSVAIEEMDTGLQLVLEYEVLVIVRYLYNVWANKIVQRTLPFAGCFKVRREVILLLLVDVWVKYLFVNFWAQIAWDASLRILNEERLVVFLQESFSHKDPFINEALLFIHADLTQLDVKLRKFMPKFFERSGLDLQFDLAPRQYWVACIVNGVDLQNLVV